MRKKLLEHISSIILVSAIFLVLIYHFHSGYRQVQTRQDARIAPYLALDFIDYDDPLHKALLKESLNIFQPGQEPEHEALIRAIEQYRAAQIAALTRQQRNLQGLSFSKLGQLSGMYVNFILVYLIVMLLTYYGVQTLAVLRFIRLQQNRESYLAELASFLQRRFRDQPKTLHLRDQRRAAAPLGKALFKGLLYLMLFSPAYVIAYSFKTRFDTDSIFFMVLLGVISNGLLITYAQKFFTFLVAESRKGYVQTAIVKNLENRYNLNAAGGVSLGRVLNFRKRFPGHVFQHIFINARYQYLATIKEQASFLITGLVIIEMALNIQGHLCYELMQNILYRQYDIVLTIILGIFLVVKGTELASDYWQYLEARRYDNEGMG